MYKIKKLGCLLILFFSFSSIIAQTYISFGAGYLLPKGASKTSEFSNSANFSNGVGKVSNFSYATGMGINLAAGYMFNKSFGVEINMSSLLGKTFTTTYTSNYFNNGRPPVTYITTINYKVPISAYVTPSLLFKANAVKGIIPYCKVGLMFLCYGKAVTNSRNYSNGSGVDYIEYETTNRFTIGIAGALGISIPVAKKVNINIECYAQGINPHSKKSTTIKHQTNGEDDLAKLSVSQKETEYSKTLDAPTTGNPNEPTKSLAYTNNYSNIGVMVHICYSFNRK